MGGRAKLREYEEFDNNEEAQRGVSHFPEQKLEITRVEKMKGRNARYIIYFGEYELSVLEDVMIKYRMIKGNTFHKNELEEIIIADERQRAYVEGLRFLGRKARTRHEISKKLKEKEFTLPIIEEILTKLEQEGLIDDSLYAKEWTRQRISNHRKGKLWVGQELRQKGIAKDDITEALGEISVEEEWNSALMVGRKKWNQIKGDLTEKKRKTFPFLMRRGYSGEVTRKVMTELVRESSEEEQEFDEDF